MTESALSKLMCLTLLAVLQSCHVSSKYMALRYTASLSCIAPCVPFIQRYCRRGGGEGGGHEYCWFLGPSVIIGRRLLFEAPFCWADPGAPSTHSHTISFLELLAFPPNIGINFWTSSDHCLANFMVFYWPLSMCVSRSPSAGGDTQRPRVSSSLWWNEWMECNSPRGGIDRLMNERDSVVYSWPQTEESQKDELWIYPRTIRITRNESVLSKDVLALSVWMQSQSLFPVPLSLRCVTNRRVVVWWSMTASQISQFSGWRRMGRGDKMFQSECLCYLLRGIGIRTGRDRTIQGALLRDFSSVLLWFPIPHVPWLLLLLWFRGDWDSAETIL